jgi:hypothetical protein
MLIPWDQTPSSSPDKGGSCSSESTTEERRQDQSCLLKKWDYTNTGYKL